MLYSMPKYNQTYQLIWRFKRLYDNYVFRRKWIIINEKPYIFFRMIINILGYNYPQYFVLMPCYLAPSWHGMSSILGYSATPCSYPNNLSSHPIRDCSMHSPLRVKIQNALNKAFQLEKTDVLFVGGRRQNRKRRKHGELRTNMTMCITLMKVNY